MQVNFSSNSQAVRLPRLEPVDVETTPVTKNKKGAMATAGEAWISTLKAKETTIAYGGGFIKGVKNAALAAYALVGLDWLATSLVNVGKGNNKLSNLITKPFELGGKAIGRLAGAAVSVCKKDGISLPKFLKTVLYDVPIRDFFKKAYKSANVSKVAKIGTPIIALATLGFTTFRSFLNANDRCAKIDMRYRGHTVDNSKS